MPYAGGNDIRMCYEEQGRGEPLLLLHGGTGGIGFRRSIWSCLAPAYTAEDLTCVLAPTRLIAGETNPWGTWTKC